MEERYVQLYRKNSATTQVQSRLIDMEVKKSISNTKKDEESFKGISLVFSKTIQQPPRLSSSATTWDAEEKKMKCIFNKGIAFSSNDSVIKHNLSTDTKILDPETPSNAKIQQTFDGAGSDQNLEKINPVSESANVSKTQFAADIYSLVKSSSNMLILEEMKANENIYNLHLGTIYTRATDDDCLADKSLILKNVIETPKCNIDKPETVLSKENPNAMYDTNRCKDKTKIILSAGEETIEMQDIKNKVNPTDLGPGVLTVTLLDDPTSKSNGSAERISANEPAHRTYPEEIKVSIGVKDGNPPSAVSSDEFNFTNSIIPRKCDAVGRVEFVSNKLTAPENLSKIPLSRPFCHKIPKTLSIIQETGYSDVNFSDCVLQSMSNTKLDSKKSDSLKLISSDSMFNKASYKIKFEPEASTSTYKRTFQSFICSSEDDAVITLEQNNVAEKDKPSMAIDKLKIGEQKTEDDQFHCEPF